MVVCTTRGKARFYNCRGTKGLKTRTYISDREKIGELANKTYCERLLVSSRNEKKQMEYCLSCLQKGKRNSDVEKVYEALPVPIRTFIKPEELTDDGYGAKWQAKNRLIKEKDKYHTIKTLRGDYVRSKSEAMIADRLFYYGIPYVYEQAGFFDEERVTVLHPDFKVLNKHTRVEYVWEHCGKMDDPKYCNDTIHRLKVFAGQGYIQGKNLLFTYETNDSPLDLDLVDSIIKEFLQKKSA